MESWHINHTPERDNALPVKLEVRQDGFINATNICKDNGIRPWAHLARTTRYQECIDSLSAKYPSIVDVRGKDGTWIHPALLNFFCEDISHEYAQDVLETLIKNTKPSPGIEEQKQKIESNKKQHDKELAQITSQHEKELAQLKLETDQAKAQHEKEMKQHEQEIAQIKLQHEKELEQMRLEIHQEKLQHEEKIEQIKVHHAEKMEQIKVEHVEKTEQTRLQHEKEMTRCGQKLERLKKNYDNACERYNNEIGMQARWREWEVDWMTVYEYVLKTYKLNMSEVTFKKVEKAVSHKFLEKYAEDVPQHWRQVNKYHELVSVVHPLNPNIAKPALPTPPKHFQKNTPTNMRVYNRRDWHLIDDQIDLYRHSPEY